MNNEKWAVSCYIPDLAGARWEAIAKRASKSALAEKITETLELGKSVCLCLRESYQYQHEERQTMHTYTVEVSHVERLPLVMHELVTPAAIHWKPEPREPAWKRFTSWCKKKIKQENNV